MTKIIVSINSKTGIDNFLIFDKNIDFDFQIYLNFLTTINCKFMLQCRNDSLWKFPSIKKET